MKENTAGIIFLDAEHRRAFIDGKQIDPRRSQKLINHSPDGFMWGYPGSGPAQLSLAILLEFIPEADARELYHDFKFEIIATLDSDRNHRIPLEDVRIWLSHRGKRANLPAAAVSRETKAS